MKELAGTYSLISSTRTIVDTGEVLDTWGKNPNGFITYGKDGRMLVLIVSDNRPKPESLAKMTDQQQADLFRTMCAYGGTYQFDGERVEHHIDISWNEIWTGTTVSQIREKGWRQTDLYPTCRTIWQRWADEPGNGSVGEAMIASVGEYS